MVNLASVLLARAAQREHEVAVSRALGANSAAVARATLFEGALLGLLGGAAGTIAAIWATRTLVALAPLDLPRREAIAVDWGIALVVVGAGLLLGVLAAVAPATWAARTSLAVACGTARSAAAAARTVAPRHVVAQVALSLVSPDHGRPRRCAASTACYAPIRLQPTRPADAAGRDAGTFTGEVTVHTPPRIASSGRSRRCPA